MTNRALFTAIAIVLVGIVSVMILEQQDTNPFDAAVESANQAYDTLLDEADDLTTDQFRQSQREPANAGSLCI